MNLALVVIACVLVVLTTQVEARFSKTALLVMAAVCLGVAIVTLVNQ